MKVGDLVTYGSWYDDNVSDRSPIGVILEAGRQKMPARYWYVMWSSETRVWELEDDIEVMHENR